MSAASFATSAALSTEIPTSATKKGGHDQDRGDGGTKLIKEKLQTAE